MSAAWGVRPLASLRKVRVGSTNGPKIAAVRAALAPYVEDLEVEGVAVSSGVADQPVGFEEIVTGARNRAHAALACGGCDLAVGIEDGLVEIHGIGSEALNIGCAAVTDGPRTAIGFSAAFAYPRACSSPALRERLPIGELFDSLWENRRGERAALPSAQSLGNVGRLTLGVLPRSDYARHAVVCALVSFLQPDLYAAEGGAS
jgi:inosine/xanthosine triphosphatase